MDSAALIGRAAFAATLKRTRLRSVDARLLSKVPSSGQLRTQTTVALTEHSGGDWLSSVRLCIEGFPKDADKASVTPEQRTFFIEIVVQGIYHWEETPKEDLLQDAELARMLGRPVYILAAAEVEAIANRLGLIGVKVEADIPKPSEASGIPLKMSEKKKLMRQLTGESVAISTKNVGKKLARPRIKSKG